MGGTCIGGGGNGAIQEQPSIGKNRLLTMRGEGCPERGENCNKRRSLMIGTAKRMLAERCARRIVDAIIEGGLIGSQCAEDKSHGIVSVWSSHTEEQLGAIVATTVESAVNAELAKWYRIYTHLRVVASMVGINHEAVRYEYADDEISGLSEHILTLNRAIQSCIALAQDTRTFEEARDWHDVDNGS